MLYNSLVSVVYAFTTVLLSGELFPAVAHAQEHPEVVTYIVAFSAINYFSVLFILMLIDHFGGPEAEIAKSIRKVASITLSFMIFSKPITGSHMLGGFLFILTVLYAAYGKISASRQRTQEKAEVRAAGLGTPRAGGRSNGTSSRKRES